MKKLVTSLIFLFLWAGSSWAGDVNLYTFASTSGTYTALSTETVLFSGTFDDNNSTAITIPAFTVNGNLYTTMFVQANGWITLGGTTISSSYTPISLSTSYPVVISAYGRDLNNAASGTPKISYNTNDGGDIVVQYQDVRRYNIAGEIFSCQIRLVPSTGVIKFVYGGTIVGGVSTSYPQVGLRGATNLIYSNRSTTTDWAATTAGGSNTATCLMSATVIPSAGLTFTFTPPVTGTPLPPTTPSPAEAALNIPVSGSVTWTFGANTTTYDLKFGPIGNMTQVVTGAAAGATGTYSYSGLAYGAGYQWQVIAKSGALTTAGPIWSFSTVCATVTAINENFDAVITPALPICWTKVGTEGSVYTQASSGNTAPNCIYIYAASGTYGATLAMPPLSNLGAGTHRLTFKLRANFTIAGVVQVGYMTDPADPATFVLLQSFTTNSASVYQDCVVLPGTTPGSSQTLAFRMPPLPGYSALIDDVVWALKPSCLEPSLAAANNITLTSANLTWTPGGTETTWQYVYGLSPLPVPTGAGTATTSSTVNPITGLIANTNYQFYVRANCGSGFSTWVGPVSFYTGYCIPAPTSVDGIGITNVTFGTVNNTTVVETGNYGDYTALIGNVQRTATVPVSITFATGFTYDTKIWVDWNNNLSFLDAGDEVYSGTSTATNPTTLAASFLVPGTATLGNHRMRIGGVDTGPPTPCYTGSYGSFEDYTINVLVAPACPAPTALNATSITQNSVNLTWTPGGTETAWQYVYGLSPLPAPSGAGTASSSSTVNPISGLAASTTYQYYVRANCGSSFSTWTGPYTFTTLCGAVIVPYTQNFDAVTAPAIPNCMLVTNDNADAVSWVTATSAPYSTPNSMRIGYNSAAAMNDWFFTPPLTLAVGTYKVTFWYRSSGATYPEKLEVKWGSAPNAAGMTNGPIFSNTNIISSSYVQASANMVVAAAGDYFVGWHGFSDTDMNYMVVDDISITQALAHDVSTVSINNIPAVYDPTPTIPKATVKNLGLNTETFTVTMTITGGYTSTKTVTALSADASVEVLFNSWTPTVGAFTAQVCTNLASDLNPTNNCTSTTGNVFNYTRFYSYIAYGGTSSLPEGPGFFYKQAPGTVVSIAPTTSAQFISAGTWANGLWYGSEYYDAALLTGGGWWTINPTTGAMTKIADLGRGFTGITYDHTANIMYGIDYDGVALTNKLYSIVPATGVATLIGSVGPGELMINLATDGSGFLYSLGITTDHLFKINPVGPTITDIGACGIDMNYGQDMEYDYASNTMYATAYTTTGSLYTVNLTTGTCTLVGGFAGGAELTGFAIPYTASKPLNLTVLLESLHVTATPGTMREAQDYTATPVPTYFSKWGAGIADKITVEIREVASGHALAGGSPYTVDLHTNGTATVNVPGTLSGNYIIVVKNRNSIDTWSNGGVSFTGSSINYSFSNAANQAYGSNMKAVSGGLFGLYGGNANASVDAKVDGTDMALVDNGSTAQLKGYIDVDVTGDGKVDGSDMALIDNNSTALVKVVPVP